MKVDPAPVKPVRIDVDGRTLDGDLSLPPPPAPAVAFAHGSGSSRQSPRNRQVAHVLQRAGLGTLLVDLLTEEEEVADRRTGELRFDIGLLSRRLEGIVDWLATEPASGARPIGLFGASTGAAAALVAAAERSDEVGAVVSRGGRPDLAGGILPEVHAPTLLLVGGADPAVIECNEVAMASLTAEKRLDVVPGATHLFQEPGALEEVAAKARTWFVDHLRTDGAGGAGATGDEVGPPPGAGPVPDD